MIRNPIALHRAGGPDLHAHQDEDPAEAERERTNEHARGDVERDCLDAESEEEAVAEDHRADIR